VRENYEYNIMYRGITVNRTWRTKCNLLSFFTHVQRGGEETQCLDEFFSSKIKFVKLWRNPFVESTKPTFKDMIWNTFMDMTMHVTVIKQFVITKFKFI